MKKLLFIDDDPYSGRMLEDYFKKDWTIISETTIEQIIKRLKNEKPDLVILNAELRRFDGEPTFQAIHDHSPDLLVIVITSSHQAKLGRRLVKQGAFWHL